MKKYKYIKILQEDGEMFKGHPVYQIFNNRTGVQIGIISWYPHWKEYMFSSQPECVFNNTCLRDVIDFMETEVVKGGK